MPRIQEKIDNMPIASDLMLDIWDSYCQLRNTKIGSELICHTIMNMSGIQNDHWCTDHVDRSPWIEVICDMLSKELSFTGNFRIPAGNKSFLYTYTYIQCTYFLIAHA